MSSARSSIWSQKLWRNLMHGDHQPRRRTSSTSSHNVVVRGLTHHPRLTINTNFLSSSSSTNIRTTYIRNAIENLPAEAPLPTPPEPSPSGWFSWILWTLIPLLFPIFKKKLSPLHLLKKKVDTAMDTMDDAATLIEVIGKEAIELTDEFENKVPDGSALKTIMCYIHDVAKAIVKLAILAKGLIHKEKEIEKEMEDLIEKQEQPEDDQGEEHK